MTGLSGEMWGLVEMYTSSTVQFRLLLPDVPGLWELNRLLSHCRPLLATISLQSPPTISNFAVREVNSLAFIVIYNPISALLPVPPHVSPPPTPLIKGIKGSPLLAINLPSLTPSPNPNLAHQVAAGLGTSSPS